MPGELSRIEKEIMSCTACGLHRTRLRAVPGEGPAPAPAAVIGEGPGAEEDRTGRPFVGRAGKLLDELLREAGIPREKLWVGNVVKCRAHTDGRDRPPTNEEIDACRRWLTRQLAAVRPGAILALGTTAASALLQDPRPVSQLRGVIHRCAWHEAWVVATYHPAYLLRQQNNEALRHEFLADLDLFRRAVRAEIGTRTWPWKRPVREALALEGSTVPLPTRIKPWPEDPSGTVDPKLAEELLGPVPFLPHRRIYWDVRNLHRCWRNPGTVKRFLQRAAEALLGTRRCRWMLCGHLPDGRPCAPLCGPYLSIAAVPAEPNG